jgi:hypothetical protein
VLAIFTIRGEALTRSSGSIACVTVTTPNTFVSWIGDFIAAVADEPGKRQLLTDLTSINASKR